MIWCWRIKSELPETRRDGLEVASRSRATASRCRSATPPASAWARHRSTTLSLELLLLLDNMCDLWHLETCRWRAPRCRSHCARVSSPLCRPRFSVTWPPHPTAIQRPCPSPGNGPPTTLEGRAWPVEGYLPPLAPAHGPPGWCAAPPASARHPPGAGPVPSTHPHWPATPLSTSN